MSAAAPCGAIPPNVGGPVPCHLEAGHDGEHFSTSGCAGSEVRWLDADDDGYEWDERYDPKEDPYRTTPLTPTAREVWDDRVAPGGYVCSVCGMPSESEPCEHLNTPLPPADLKALIRDLGDMACIGCRNNTCPACELAAEITNRVHLMTRDLTPGVGDTTT